MSHSGNELDLMLNGKKAMAAFYRQSSEHFDEFGGQKFDPHVLSGLLGKKKFFVKNHQGENIVYTVYYIKGQEWRCKLYVELKKSIADGWSIDKEVIESLLLDYNNEDIMQYVERLGR